MAQLALASTDVPSKADSCLRILWVGPIQNRLRTGLEKSALNHELELVESLSDIVTGSSSGMQYDCMVINLQEDNDGPYLHMATLLASTSCKKLLVLAPPNKVECASILPGVSCVLHRSVSVFGLVSELQKFEVDENEFEQKVVEVSDHEKFAISKPWFSIVDEIPEESGTTGIEVEKHEEKPVEPKTTESVTSGFETSVSLAEKIDNSIWRRFLPLVNFAYKKLAIVVLASLFLTFLTYGAMIVFYLTSSSWVLPFELSSGNKIVEKVERNLSQLRVSQNMFRQQLTVNDTELSIAGRKEREGQLQIETIRKSIEEEIYSRQREQNLLVQQIGRLSEVEKRVVSAKDETDFPKYYDKIKKAYRKKFVSRRAMENVRLSVIEAEHRLANVRNQISTKQEQLAMSKRQVRYLRRMLPNIADAELYHAPVVNAEFSQIVAELMKARTARLSAKAEISAAEKRKRQLEDSLQVVTRNIDNIMQTPAARAVDGPVAVMFVPYQNSDAAVQQVNLYGCKFFIFVCEKVGALGRRVDGETVAAHPLFEKPMRGYFVEAKFDNRHSVTEEILHVGGAPFLF